MINIDIAESVKCNGDYSLFISFDYDQRIVDMIRALPTRYYNSADKEWEVPFNKLSDIVNQLSNFDIRITGKYINLHEKEEIEIPADFTFKTTPFEHQIDGFKFGLSNDRWLLGDEQGLGKTKQAIDIAIARKVKHCLIVCCVNSLKWNWQREIATHSNEKGWILGQRVRNGKTYIGTNAERLEDLNDIDNMPYFIITNIETLRYKGTNSTYPITEKLQKLCDSGDIGMIVVDEFHKCKNPAAEQAKQILRLQAKVEIAMTGTPLMNTPVDLFMPLKWLGYEKHSFYAFKNHHCVMGGYGGYQIVGYKNLDELSETLDTIMLRRLKEDVLDLPEKMLINEVVEMNEEQERIYYEAKNEVVNNIDKIKMSNNPLSELIRLRQATGYTGIISSTVKESAKFERMLEIVEDAVENGQKVVIFSNWTQMTNPAFKLLSKKYSGVMITGDTKDNERQNYVDRFQNDDNVKFIIGTIGAMGTGLTLTAGTVEIFLDEPWNMALKEQAIDRCHRIGAKSTITIYTLICKDTIDERINDIVEKKGAIADILVDGKIDGDKNALVNYLLS